MSDEDVILSKKVRPNFTGELTYDHWADNPREWVMPSTSIHLWDNQYSDRHNSEEIRSYKDAIHKLYQSIYPELIDRCLDDETPEEVLDLMEETEYPGTVLWLTLDWYNETRINASSDPDEDRSRVGGVAFINEQGLQEDNLSREEGEVRLRNDILMVEQHMNGHVYVLTVNLDGETEHHGELYPITVSGEATGKITPMVDCYIPPETLLDEILMETATSENDRALIATRSWE